MTFYENMNLDEWLLWHQQHVLGCPVNGSKRHKSKMHWRGVEMIKSPLDLQVYQEIIHETNPSIIIELGTYRGGSTMYLADVMQAKHPMGLVIGVDHRACAIKHPNVRHVVGNTTDQAAISRVLQWIRPTDRVMVIQDADHSIQGVYDDLVRWSPLVTEGCYFIVEDGATSFIKGKPKSRGGPLGGIDKFLLEDDHFKIDKSREKYIITYNPDGFLRKIS